MQDMISAVARLFRMVVWRRGRSFRSRRIDENGS